MVKSFKDLEAYQNSKKLYPKLVELTSKYPTNAKYLVDQSCRAANAIHADIAEGYGRSVNEFKYYLTRALGSCNELLSHLEDAQAVKYLNDAEAAKLIKEYTIVGKQIYRLREAWK